MRALITSLEIVSCVISAAWYIYISRSLLVTSSLGGGGEKGIRISSSEANVRGELSWLSGINRRGEYSVLNFEGGIKNRYVDRISNEGREHLS